MRLKPIIALLVILSFILYYNLTENTIKTQQTKVIRIVDGDTIETDLGKIRLLGINTPEKNQPLHNEAENFLKNLENKQVEIELHGKDKYSRFLAYIYFNNNLVNKNILENGLANLYYYDKDSHYSELKKAEESARNSELGIWKKSNNSNCIKLVSLLYKDNGKCENQEQLILQNSCQKLDVIIKDDANHIYSESVNNGIFTKNFSCIWNDAGDTLYIRDNQGMILFYRYF